MTKEYQNRSQFGKDKDGGLAYQSEIMADDYVFRGPGAFPCFNCLTSLCIVLSGSSALNRPFRLANSVYSEVILHQLFGVWSTRTSY